MFYLFLIVASLRYIFILYDKKIYFFYINNFFFYFYEEEIRFKLLFKIKHNFFVGL